MNDDRRTLEKTVKSLGTVSFDSFVGFIASDEPCDEIESDLYPDLGLGRFTFGKKGNFMKILRADKDPPKT